jgi:hypothetical protein
MVPVNASSGPKTDRRSVRRWAFPVLIGIWLSISWLRHGFGTTDVVLGALSLFWLGTAWLIQNRTTRPRQTFCWLALASSVVAALFMGFGAVGTEAILPGLIGWAGVTVLGLIWCIHFERTERPY